MPWADLLRRVFSAEALIFPHCSAAMVVLAYLTDPRVVTTILTHLGLPSSAPALSSARLFGQLELFDEDAPGSCPLPGEPDAGSRSSRGPPPVEDWGDRVVERSDPRDF